MLALTLTCSTTVPLQVCVYDVDLLTVKMLSGKLSIRECFQTKILFVGGKALIRAKSCLKPSEHRDYLSFSPITDAYMIDHPLFGV